MKLRSQGGHNQSEQNWTFCVSGDSSYYHEIVAQLRIPHV